MSYTQARWLCVSAVLAVTLGCGDNPRSPVSPSAEVAGRTGAAADGSTLKATAPTPVSPENGSVVDTPKPTLEVTNATARYSPGTSFEYRFQVEDDTGALLHSSLRQPQGAGGTTKYTLPADLAYDKAFRWHARAELGTALGPWSPFVTFTTPTPPAPPSVPSPGGDGRPFGPPRTISVGEAWNIIVRIHDELRYNLGSGSAREDRVTFLWTAVAVVHFGHARFNPLGGDRNWCVKDAGGGRPPSDDVLVLCDTRDAWDLIGSAGVDGYTFHLDYIGRLGNEQNVYPPPLSYLPR